MTELEMLSVKIYEFQSDPNITNRILEQVENFTYSDNQKNETFNRTNLMPFFYDKELFDWFNSCLEKVRKIHFVENSKLVITDCWINKTRFTGAHHDHHHANSIVSGVFYLNSCMSGKTVFHLNDPWIKYNDFLEVSHKPSTFEISAIAGKLILFPSSIRHGVLPNKDKMTRYSIAFNTFIKGEFGHTNTGTYLNLTPKSIEDTFNEINSGM